MSARGAPTRSRRRWFSDSGDGSRMGSGAMVNSNLTWLLPFACLGLVALATARPEPQAPPPQGDRVVTDARGKQVHIGVPFRGRVLTRGTETPEYREASDAPDTLLAVTAYGMGTR